MKIEFHHIGVPTDQEQEGERYSEPFGMYTSGGLLPFRIQYHRFDDKCPLHKDLQNLVHVAFKVDDLEQAIDGEEVILAPYEPIKGFKVACVKRHNLVLEFIETTLSEDDIWDDSKHKGSVIYPDE